MTNQPTPPPDPKSKTFIVGCGDIGLRVARLEQQAGRCVSALARSEASAASLISRNIEVIRGDLDQPETLTALPTDIETLFYFAPPPPTGSDDPRLERCLSALPELPKRFVYISTSGVYGDCDGAWIDEDWPLQPKTDRGKRRLQAELTLRKWHEQQGLDMRILRVPGIYGPGRLPVERVRQGVPVIQPQESAYSNRIHADDLAAACLAAADRGTPGGVYNISDGHPTTMSDYFWRIADLYGLPRPPAISLAEARQVLSANMLSFLEESKRLDNRRMLTELQVELRYPDLGSGLPSCL